MIFCKKNMNVTIGTIVQGKKFPNFNEQGMIMDIRKCRRDQEFLIQWTSSINSWVKGSNLCFLPTIFENTPTNQNEENRDNSANHLNIINHQLENINAMNNDQEMLL